MKALQLRNTLWNSVIDVLWLFFQRQSGDRPSALQARVPSPTSCSLVQHAKTCCSAYESFADVRSLASTSVFAGYSAGRALIADDGQASQVAHGVRFSSQLAQLQPPLVYIACQISIFLLSPFALRTYIYISETH